MSVNHQTVRFYYGNFIGVAVNSKGIPNQCLFSVFPKLVFNNNLYSLPADRVTSSFKTCLKDVTFSKTHNWCGKYNEDYITQVIEMHCARYPDMHYIKEMSCDLPLIYNKKTGEYEDIFVIWDIAVHYSTNLEQDFLSKNSSNNRYQLIRRVLPQDDKFNSVIRLGVIKPSKQRDIIELLDLQGQAVSLATAIDKRIIMKQPFGNINYLTTNIDNIYLNHGYYHNNSKIASDKNNLLHQEYQTAITQSKTATKKLNLYSLHNEGTPIEDIQSSRTEFTKKYRKKFTNTFDQLEHVIIRKDNK